MAITKKNGRYKKNVYIGDGKYKTVYGKTMKELNANEGELRSKLNKGFDILAQQDTLRMWQNRVCSIKESQLQPKVYKDFKHKTEAFLEELGDMRLIDIKQIHIQPIVDSLAIENPTTGKPTAKKTLRMYVVYLSQIFEYAIENRVTEYNPCKYVKIPITAKEEQRRSLSFEEQKMITTTEHKATLPAYLALFAGLRRSEITALLWSDIDFEKHTITINKAVDLYSNTVKPPKTQAGYRTVTVPEVLMQCLKKQARTSIYVVTNSKGERMTNKSWQCLWNDYLMYLDSKFGMQSICEKKMDKKKFNKFTDISIQPFGLHDLRHTCATNMYFAKVPVIVCKDQLGHSDIVTTLKIYTHCEKSEKINAVESLNDYINQKIMAGK